MIKNIVIKIISVSIIFTFAIFFIQAILPLTASADNTILKWENPNGSGPNKNPYKFKTSDVLNSQLIMQVVGCTGVVDKVSEAVTNFVHTKAKKAADKLLKEKRDAAMRKTCEQAKKTSTAGVASIPNLSLTDVTTLVDCKTVLNTIDNKTLDAVIEAKQSEQAAKTREECFNGIAVTLARNQLTSMTRYAMNWVNSGFSGDPMYVQNMTKFTNTIGQGVVEGGVSLIKNPNRAYPYGADFSRSIIRSPGGGLKFGTDRLLDNLTSDLGNFITDPESIQYTSDGSVAQRQVNKDERAAKKAKEATDRFANDFATGGWNAWIALTQREANNPLGFNISATQYLSDRAMEETQKTKEEIYQNNGFLSQKKCVLWYMIDAETGDYIYEAKPTGAGSEMIGDIDDDFYKVPKTTTNPVLAGNTNKNGLGNDGYYNDICAEWDVVTPGSLIKDKVSNYINSPERQLELADTINDSLNNLFSLLISEFQNKGLSSLASEKYEYTSIGMGGGPGSNSIDLFSNAAGGKGYTNGSFDLTRDLGNRFIHNYRKESIGDWNAKANTPKLSIGLAPLKADGSQWGANVFYTVKVAGKTKLFENGYNNWEVGDRAFWNGTEWQNWQKTTIDKKTQLIINTNPIEKRGVIQIQKDYVVAAKDLLQNLPGVMPKIGELDYCIPGPNPNWNEESLDATAVFGEYSGSITAEFRKGALFRRKSNTYSIAVAGDAEYDNYRGIFKYTAQSLWSAILNTSYWNRLQAFGNMGTVKGSQANLDKFQQGINDYLEKINVDTKIFMDMYGIYIDKVYGPKSLMQTQFIQTEDTSDLKLNTAWLEMSSEGLDITKDIKTYNDDIITTANEYTDAIVKANANISKLNSIKDQVNKIIIAAQKRRDANLIKLLNDEAKENKTSVLTEAQYREKYKDCLKEEQIVYYDDLSIMGLPSSEKDRCTDGLDNDIDGLVDDLDPDCKNFTPPAEPQYACIADLSLVSDTEIDDDGNLIESGAPFLKDDTLVDPIPEDTTPCTQRTAAECMKELYYSGGYGMRCKLPSN